MKSGSPLVPGYFLQGSPLLDGDRLEVFDPCAEAPENQRRGAWIPVTFRWRRQAIGWGAPYLMFDDGTTTELVSEAQYRWPELEVPSGR